MRIRHGRIYLIKMIKFRLNVILLLGMVAGSGFIDAKQLSLSVVDEEIRVDGILAEDVYQQKEWNEGFHAVFGPDQGKQETRFLLFADKQNLYFAAVLDEPASRVVTPTKRSDGVMTATVVERNDSLAVSFSMNEDRSEFVRYLLNPDGVLLKLEYSQDGFLQQTVESEAQVAVQVQQGKVWTVELAIPLVELNINPDFQDWRFQVTRNRRERAGEELRRFWERSTWTLARSGEDVMAFAKLSPGNLDLARYAWKLRTSDSKVVRRGGHYYFSQVVGVENRTGEDQEVVLQTRIGSGVGGDLTLPIQREGREQLRLLFDLGEELPTERVQVRHALVMNTGASSENSGIVAVHAERMGMEYEPVRLVLSAPGYRGTIYETQKLQVVEGTLHFVDEGLAVDNLKATLSDSRGQEFVAELERVEDTVWSLRIPGVPDMTVGRLQVQVSGGLGEQSWKLERTLRKVSYQRGEIWIDERGVIYRDGQPFPVYGFMFGHWRDIDSRRVPGMSFNVAGPVYIGTNWEAIVRLTDQLGEKGIYSGVYAPTGLVDGRNLAGKTSLTDAQRQEYRKLARFFRNKESVLYYYLYDEPEGTGSGGVSPGILKEIYDILAEEDPYRPVVILNHTVRGVMDYQYGSDISNPDPYPVFLESGGTARSMSRYGAYLDQIRTGEDSYRAKWITPQAFDWTYFGGEMGRRGPSVREMRTQQLISLIHGAVGVTWYPEYLVWDEVGVQVSLPYLSREYDFLFPRLVETRPEVLQSSSGASVGITGKDGEWILMVVNTLWEEVEIEIQDPRLASIQQWARLGTSEVQEGGKETLRVRLKAHESAILGSTEMPWPENLDWEAVEKEEARMYEKLVTPGNLAHRSRGVQAVAVNIQTRAQVRPMYMINGIKDPRSLGFNHQGFEPGMGAELTFPEKIKATRLVLIGSNITKGVIEIEQQGEWRTLAKIDDQADQNERSYDLQGEEFSKLRVIAEAIDHNNTMRIRELEIYE